jgi:hypothetical protein
MREQTLRDNLEERSSAAKEQRTERTGHLLRADNLWNSSGRTTLKEAQSREQRELTHAHEQTLLNSLRKNQRCSKRRAENREN